LQRIRAIKPDFFKHEGLFELEQETGLPIRLSFAGLWTCCDREGRFHWRPRRLKTDILPYDDCEFEDVLNAMAAANFVVKYEVDGVLYGFIPSFHKHQVINTREARSILPGPDADNAHVHYCEHGATRTCMHVHEQGACINAHMHAQGEGKGRKEDLNTLVPTSAEVGTAELKFEPPKTDQYGIAPAEKTADLKDTFAYYLEKTGRNPKLNTFGEEKKRVGSRCYEHCLDRAKRGDSPAEHRTAARALMRVAIDALAASDFHMGRDQKSGGKAYNDWEHVFKSVGKLESWWNRAAVKT
jgi:hypothetical protein